MTRVMYDSVDTELIPRDAHAVALYIDGSYANWSKRRQFKANKLSITVRGDQTAAACDCERGDLSPASAADWAHARIALGHPKPVIYASRDTIPQLLAELRARGVSRSQVRLWSAHYSFPHICSPVSCGASFTADATQYTDLALGRNLDESLIADGFFPPAPKPSPKPHPKVIGATGGAALIAIVTALLHAAGVTHLTPAETSALSTLAAALGGYITPAKKTVGQ